MYWLFLIPLFVVIVIFLGVIFVNYESMSVLGDPQDHVGKACKIEYEVKEESEQTLVWLEREGIYRVLRLSTFKGTIERHTRVLIVKYEPDHDSYKIERYE